MSDHNLAAILTNHGVRPTQQRVAVYDYLLEHRTHPSADTIYSALIQKYPVFSRTTIYNSLNALVSAGLVRIVTINSDEQRFDADIRDHGHFRCTQCKEIFDFEIEASEIRALCPDGFYSDQGDLYFIGHCPKCINQK